MLRKREERRGELEEAIARGESEIAAYEAELGNFKSTQESIRLAKLIETRRAELKQMLEEWETLSASLEEPS